jgi:hypothetical protein
MSESSESRRESGETPQAASGTSKADADHAGETASPESATVGGISDEQLPEDLQPRDDNPLAQPLDPDDESTKSQEELQMDATQEDLGNDDGASQAPHQAGAESEAAGQATAEPDAGTEDTSAEHD